LFCLFTTDDEKKFYNVDNWSVSVIAILPTAFYTGTYDVPFPGTNLGPIL
jgi:hypothetical protein